MDPEVARAQQRVGVSLRGKYLLTRVLGIGAMAAVYEATHRNGTRVAVKVLHREIATETDVKERFKREGYIANRIEHPSVVRIIDDDEDADGTVFIVMELLDGRTLESELKAIGGRMPAPRVIAIVDALLDILEIAHAAGVVHRDIKPDNIFLTSSGLKILDFGIARLMDLSSGTKSGQMMGTPEFISPEQAGGETRQIDGRTDLFSVGAMMFTMLSADFVQHARSAIEYMVFAATRPARSITTVLPDVDPALANVIDVALAFEKVRRWPTARHMQTALRAAASQLIPRHDPSARPGDRMSEPAAPTMFTSAPTERPPEISSTRTVPLGRLPPDLKRK